VARVVVEVMLKPEILDPQGKAVNQALARLGFVGVREVRQGKRFEIEVDGPVTEDRLVRIHDAAATLLSNPVIEDYAVHVDGQAESEPSDEREQPSDEHEQPSDERVPR
jgi:phosphoribosylformylglycinamidine synthase subunit PurS